MKYFKMITVAVVAVAGSCLLRAGLAQAQQFSPNVGSSKTVNSSLFSGARTVHIDGTVNGDVYCLGQDVTITGTIHGDVLCAGQKVNINGTVDGSVRVSGQDVTINGKIGRSLSVAGQQVSVDRRTVIGGDAAIAASTLDLNGSIKRDAVITSTQAKVGAVVGRNLRFGGTQLALENDAVIKGDVNYTSKQSITLADHAMVTGATVHQTKQPKKGLHIFGRSPMNALIVLAGFMIFCLFLVWFFPQQIHHISQVAVDSLGKTVLVGFASLIAFPFLISVLAATLLGIPLAALLLLLGLSTIILSIPVAAYYFGSMLWSKSKNPVYAMLLGSGVLAVAYMVPIVGALLIFIAYLIGSGSLLITAKRAFPNPNYKIK